MKPRGPLAVELRAVELGHCYACLLRTFALVERGKAGRIDETSPQEGGRCRRERACPWAREEDKA